MCWVTDSVKVAEGSTVLPDLFLREALRVSDEDLVLGLVQSTVDGGIQLSPVGTQILLAGEGRGGEGRGGEGGKGREREGKGEERERRGGEGRGGKGRGGEEREGKGGKGRGGEGKGRDGKEGMKNME